MDSLKNKLERIYQTYNRRRYVDPDPLLLLYKYPRVKDREIAGFIASCFAYGKVRMILKTSAFILDALGPSPFDTITACSKKDLAAVFKGFRYRFATAQHLVDLLWGIRQVVKNYGSLYACFYRGLSKKDQHVINALLFFSDQIRLNLNPGHLLADPAKKSACKRSHLFLRWMVRNDRVDPGGWEAVGPARLIIPLDVHMHRIGTLLGFTGRKSADIRTSLEITAGFRQLVRNDPVKYDFCLTRFGIRKEMAFASLEDEMIQSP